MPCRRGGTLDCDHAVNGRGTGRRSVGDPCRRGRVRGAGRGVVPDRRLAWLALGPAIRAAGDPCVADAGGRRPSVDGRALSADNLGTGASQPCRRSRLFRVIHRALAVAADLLRCAMVGVRCRLHRLCAAGAADLALGAAATWGSTPRTSLSQASNFHLIQGEGAATRCRAWRSPRDQPSSSSSSGSSTGVGSRGGTAGVAADDRLGGALPSRTGCGINCARIAPSGFWMVAITM